MSISQLLIKETLKTHTDAVHLNLRPFQCLKCSKAFKNKRDRKMHMERFHSGLRPFACLRYGKIFSEKGILKEHINENKCSQDTAEINREQEPSAANLAPESDNSQPAVNPRSALPIVSMPRSQSQAAANGHYREGTETRSTAEMQSTNVVESSGSLNLVVDSEVEMSGIETDAEPAANIIPTESRTRRTPLPFSRPKEASILEKYVEGQGDGVHLDVRPFARPACGARSHNKSDLDSHTSELQGCQDEILRRTACWALKYNLSPAALAIGPFLVIGPGESSQSAASSGQDQASMEAPTSSITAGRQCAPFVKATMPHQKV
jgi:hypothetical protein